MRLRERDTYRIEHQGKFIKGSKQLSYDISQFLSIAFEKGVLTAGDILDIAVDNGPDPVESELEADMYESDVNKFNVGKFKIQFDDV